VLELFNQQTTEDALVSGVICVKEAKFFEALEFIDFNKSSDWLAAFRRLLFNGNI
jgi:hypothetical protein